MATPRIENDPAYPKTPTSNQYWRASFSNREQRIGGQAKTLTLHELASKHCKPCEGAEAMVKKEIEQALGELPAWTLVGNSIQREFRFKSYLGGLDFAYAVGKIAEEQDHHPDMAIGWRRVKLTFSTHSIKGLSPNDFIMAAKSELEYGKFASR